MHVIGLLDGEVVFDGSRDDFFRDFELQERLGSSSLRKWKYTGNYPAIFPAWNLFIYGGRGKEAD